MGNESGAPHVVQTSVTLYSVKLSPLHGTGATEGFVIGSR
jgi:hypothetical protein